MTMNMTFKTIVLSSVAVLTLAGCSNAKEELGLTRRAPDEFAVTKRAPLSMPPGYALAPPRPGAPRPQEQSAADAARSSVFGDQAQVQTGDMVAPAGDAESALLNKVGAERADPGIRYKVDQETAAMAKDSLPVAKKLLGRGQKPDDAPTSVVNPAKETERLQQNKQAGKPVTTGNTPAIQK